MIEYTFYIFFALFLVFFVAAVSKTIATWRKNSRSPRLTVTATVASKRKATSVQNHPVNGDVSGAHGYHTTTTESYYITFQVQSGDTMEFSVKSSEYRMINEGERGNLSFQGTWFLGFERL